MDLLESTLLLLLGELGRSTGSSRLGLLSLSGLLGKLLGLLVLLQLLISGSLSLSRLLVSSLLDQFNGSTNNTSLVLDGLSGSLSGGLLGDTLLVLSSVQNSPSDSSWVLSLLEKRRGLGRLESEDLGVTSDEQSTSTWVDLGTRKGVNFNLHFLLLVRAGYGRTGKTRKTVE